MSLAALRQLIEVDLSTNFTSYPIKYENVPFDPPTNASWIACHIKRNILPTPELDSSGEVMGILIIQVFTPLNSGLATSNTIVDTLAGLYSNEKRIANLWFQDAAITDIGKSDIWYQVNISVPFNYIGV
jgi:hypothetical protein